MATEELLNGRYEIVATIGEGRITTTYRALDRQTGRQCTVKRLFFKKLESWKGLELFEREARVLAHLDHPRIPRMLDFFRIETDGGLEIYSVREYVEGQDLSHLIKSGRRFTEADVVRIGVEMAKLLEYLHDFSPPILHRDIKPSNIVMAPQGEMHLIDFGAVGAGDPATHERGTTVAGTFGYMPLEQFTGRPAPASDIYSLGATMLYLLFHRDPAEMLADDGSIDFSQVRVSKGVTRILRKMLRRNVARRYATASLLREDLEDLLAGQPRRRRFWLITGAALLGVVLGAGAGLRSRFADSTAEPLETSPSWTVPDAPAAVRPRPHPPAAGIAPLEPVGPVTNLPLISALYSAREARPNSLVKSESVLTKLVTREGRYDDPETTVQIGASNTLRGDGGLSIRPLFYDEVIALEFSTEGLAVGDQHLFLELEAACAPSTAVGAVVANRFGDWDHLPPFSCSDSGKWAEVKKVIELGRPWSDRVRVRLSNPTGLVRFDFVRTYLASVAPEAPPAGPSASSQPASPPSGTPVPLTGARLYFAPPGLGGVDEAALLRKLARRESDYTNAALSIDFPFGFSVPRHPQLELTFSVPAAKTGAPDARELVLDVAGACCPWAQSLQFEAFNRFQDWDRLGNLECKGQRWQESQATFPIGKPFGPTLRVRVTGSGKLDSAVAYLK